MRKVRVMFCENNAFTYLATYCAEEKEVRILATNETAEHDYRGELASITDDSGWERYSDVEDVEAFLGVNYVDKTDATEILDEIYTEL